MRNFFIIASLIFFNSCISQQVLTKKYNATIVNDDYQSKLELINDNTHRIRYKRYVDSLSFSATIRPSLKSVFDSISSLDKNKLVGLIIKKKIDSLYEIEAIGFVHLDGRKKTIDQKTDEAFNIDLSVHKIVIDNCMNCKERISFTIFKY